MTENTDHPFSRRAFVVTAAGLAALGLPVTGVAMHVASEGGADVARHAWMSAHNLLALLFLVFATWHVALNWRGLVRHLRGARAHMPMISREAACALIVVGGLLAVAVSHAFHLR